MIAFRNLVLVFLLACGGCASASRQAAAIKCVPLPNGFVGSFSPTGYYLVADSYLRSMSWPIDVFVTLGDYNRLAPQGQLRVSMNDRTLRFEIFDAQGRILHNSSRSIESVTVDGVLSPAVSEKVRSGDEWGHRSTVKTVSFHLGDDGALILKLHESGTATGLVVVPLPYSSTHVVRFAKLHSTPSEALHPAY